MQDNKIYLLSNRGPIRWKNNKPIKSSGGLSSAVSGITNYKITWFYVDTEENPINNKITELSTIITHTSNNLLICPLYINPYIYNIAYNDISNNILWRIFHQLYSTKEYNTSINKKIEYYIYYNYHIANKISSKIKPNSYLLIQDYHMLYVSYYLKRMRPDIKISHFYHTPFVDKVYYNQLPKILKKIILLPTIHVDNIGFLCDKWKVLYLKIVNKYRINHSNNDILLIGSHKTTVNVSRIGINNKTINETLKIPYVNPLISKIKNNTKVILRIDRLDPSKNIINGLLAYDHFLEHNHEYHNNIIHIMLCYLSRTDSLIYQEYQSNVELTINEINTKYKSNSWIPILYFNDDNYLRSINSYKLADILLINSLRDGMNLVAKEGAYIGKKTMRIVLSHNTGVYEEFNKYATIINNPNDIIETSEAIKTALKISDDIAKNNKTELKKISLINTSNSWLLNQINQLQTH